MSKFLKRIQKSVKKDISNVVVLGNDNKSVNDILENFRSVFYIDFSNPIPRNRNIIPIRELSFLSNVYEVDIIFINQGYDDRSLQFIPTLTKKCLPVIFLNQDFTISNEYYDFFKRIRYEMISTVDNYQVWKVIRK